MKNLFASVSYSFSNFYEGLNIQGQIIFCIIMFLILTLCLLLFISYVVQSIKNKMLIKELKKENSALKNKVEEKVKIIEEKEPLYQNEKTEIEDIAEAISNALDEEKPIAFTNFEEEQERTAIISIEELMEKAKDLHILDDDNGSIDFVEKYNEDALEVEKLADSVVNNNIVDDTKEVKAFRVSQVISPIYGIRKDNYEGSEY